MMLSERQLRVGEIVRHAMCDILMRDMLRDPSLDGKIITVPEVRMSPDLKLATIFIAALGKESASDVVETLNRNKRWLRGQITRRLTLKFSPDIRFRIDDRFDEASRIDALLRSPAVARDLNETTPHEDDA